MNVDEFVMPIWAYHSEYTHNDGFGDFLESVEDHDLDFEEMIEFCRDEYNLGEGKIIRPGELWVGSVLGDVDIDEDADEDGKYLYTNVFGAFCIVSTVRLMDDEQKFLEEYDELFDRLMDDIVSEAEGKIEEELEAWQDEKLYRRDPYAYYGVRRSDFL